MRTFSATVRHTMGLITISRDIIQTVNAGASITVVNEHTGQLCSDAEDRKTDVVYSL